MSDEDIRKASPAIALAQDMGMLPSENGPTETGQRVLRQALNLMDRPNWSWHQDQRLGAPPEDGDWMACLVCRRTLESFRDTDTGELIWDHSSMDVADGVNHRAVPVSYKVLGLDNVRLRCDFCGQHDPIFEVPVADFSMTRLGRPWGSNSDWCACDVCADLIDREAWPQLTRRTTERATRRARLTRLADIQAMAREIRELHREVRRHQEGPSRLIRNRITAFTAELDSAHRFSAFRRQP